MLSPSDNNQADVVDDLLNIDNPYFEQMVSQIYPTELQLNKAISSITEAPFLDLVLSITATIYDKRDDFNFEMVNFYFLVKKFLPPLSMVYTFRNLLVL